MPENIPLENVYGNENDEFSFPGFCEWCCHRRTQICMSILVSLGTTFIVLIYFIQDKSLTIEGTNHSSVVRQVANLFEAFRCTTKNLTSNTSYCVEGG
ncbi:unnamed protein product [Clavelina lepadiformis]|uniref:Uncharacterized protein n=1 Tax=Clavelina lepadiformis TaxID=159417 RepID=A0ABP0GZD1_CLALP